MIYLQSEALRTNSRSIELGRSMNDWFMLANKQSPRTEQSTRARILPGKPMIKIAEIPIPTRMKWLARDHRGYPVPYLVQRDRAGRPHFTISSSQRVTEVATRKKCGLCGKSLDLGAWFVGGPRSFLHPRGAFSDPAMHEDCARYALQICPWLAAPNYARRIEDRTLRGVPLQDADTVTINDLVLVERPALFGLGFTAGYRFDQGTFKATGWSHLEWWQQGQILAGDDAARLIDQIRLDVRKAFA